MIEDTRNTLAWDFKFELSHIEFDQNSKRQLKKLIDMRLKILKREAIEWINERKS